MKNVGIFSIYPSMRVGFLRDRFNESLPVTISGSILMIFSGLTISGMMRFEFYFQFYKESNLLPNIFLAKWRNK